MSATTAELLMAEHLRELGLYFEQEYEYARPRRFRADFAVWRRAQPCWWTSGKSTEPDDRLCLIEIQGGIFSRQAHGSITGIKADNARLNAATFAGWKILRFRPDEVESGEARERIREWLEGGG